MKIVVSLDVEDYVYHFYQKTAEALNRRPEVLMEQALYLYAGMAAQEILQKPDPKNGVS